jgi:hypothetical protein
MVAVQLMEAEISAKIGASRGERSPERATHRNGYRARPWETTVGDDFPPIRLESRSANGPRAPHLGLTQDAHASLIAANSNT